MLSIATQVDDLEWPWTSIYCSVVSFMRVATKWLKLKSRRFHCKIALYYSYMHIKFDYAIFSGVSWSGDLKIGWGGFQLRGTISWRRCEIELRSQLITNRKSCIYVFDWISQWPWVTLNMRVQRSAIVSRFDFLCMQLCHSERWWCWVSEMRTRSNAHWVLVYCYDAHTSTDDIMLAWWQVSTWWKFSTLTVKYPEVHSQCKCGTRHRCMLPTSRSVANVEWTHSSMVGVILWFLSCLFQW